MAGTFATTINCMDGRTQEPVAKWIKETFGVDYVDTITVAGPDKVLSQGNFGIITNIRERVGISRNAHGSELVVIVSHWDCAGNPVSKEEHIKHNQKSIEVIKSWGMPLRILGIWLDENWNVEVLSDTAQNQ